MILRTAFFLAFSLIVFSCSQPENKSAASETPEQTNAANPTEKNSTKKTIVFFGNSLTAGYGLTNVKDGYVSLLQQRMDSLGLPYHAVNAGLSGETSAGGNERVDWVIKQPVDIFVLELGGNDALRGIQPEETVKNLGSILDKVKAKYPQAKLVLAGMQAPPNLGKMYADKFKAMYPELAREHGAELIPFLLEGVGGIPELNQGDRIHPNEKGQFILRENVWKILEPIL
ncbi:MAG: arylesterase [Bacteroidetes bacterium]|nr:arylesterase [Bacteroidota bacterium]